MSQENIDTKDPNLIIRELKDENESLKMRIVELEEEIKILLGSKEPYKQIKTPEVHYEPITPTPTPEKEVIVSSSAFSSDTVPLEMGKGPIVEGMSRRECPICGNTNKALIYENLDRTHIISAYPRMYGKKYKCGECGREWRIPVGM
ncbi:MAG: hypothetical protein ACFE9S_04660 [Candidatus Hermodarchaeota archaeon]